MAAKQTEKKKDLPKWEFRGYIRADLQRSEREDFNAWSRGMSMGDVLEWMCSTTDDGYKIVLGVNKAGLCASMHNVDGEKDSQGYILTAYATTMDQACLLLYYKHVQKLNGHWPTSDEDGDMGLR